MTPPNAQLAGHARQLASQAPDGSPERKAAGCCAAALATTHTTHHARRVLTGWDGPAVIRDHAIAILDSITGGTRP